MKLRLAPHHPVRFGSSWRGHELLLRFLQVGVLVLFAAVGVKWIAQGLVQIVEALARMLS